MRITIRILASFACCATAGCATLPADVEILPYSNEWAPLEQASSCADFVGIYKNAGYCSRPTKNGVTQWKLQSALGFATAGDATDVAFVVIRSDRERVTLQAAALDRNLRTIDSVASPIVCENGRLSRRHANTHYAEGTTSVSEETIIFSLAEDGALIAQLTGSVKSTDLLPNRSRQYDIFYRFERSTR